MPATLPRLAGWLLLQFGSAHYRDSLLGDLIEQRRAGRSSLWCWQQVIYALWWGRLDALGTTRWMAAIKAMNLAFGLVVLGAGTLAWAESVHGDNRGRPANGGAPIDATSGR